MNGSGAVLLEEPLDLLSADEVAAFAATVSAGSGVLSPAGLPHLEDLSLRGQLDLLVALERQAAWLAAQQQKLLAAIARNPARPLSPPRVNRRGDMVDDLAERDKDWIREDVAAALRLAPVTAHGWLHDADTLVRRFPATLAELEEGVITARHATDLVHATYPLPEEVAAAVEARVLPKAGGQTAAEFRRSIKRAITALDPRGQEQQERDAAVERRVCFAPGEHADAQLWATGPAEGIATLHAAITALTDTVGADDPRTADQRRFDALVHLAQHFLDGCTGAGADGAVRLPEQQGRRPSVQVTVALSTLLGLDEQPADLDGHGPITAAAARRLAGDPSSTWRRLVTDHLGQLLDYGRSVYRPPQDLIDHVAAHDVTCRFPGCHRKARRCEVDHVLAWDDGGITAPGNLQCLCPRHHALKHEAGWQVQRLADGTTVWTSPNGRVHSVPPHQHPTDRTAELLNTEPDDEPDDEPPPF